jgi:hypothetical protein
MIVCGLSNLLMKKGLGFPSPKFRYVPRKSSLTSKTLIRSRPFRSDVHALHIFQLLSKACDDRHRATAHP